MRSRLTLLAGLLALGVALSTPVSACADVGLGVPTATSYLAAVQSAPAGVKVKVGEGDRLLWMGADADLTVTVIGIEGEPYLRFSPGGVQLNEHSPTAYLNSYRSTLVPTGITSHTRPSWKLLTRGHTYIWPEDRLHELDLAAHVPGVGGYVGRWTIPLRVNDKLEAISGSLTYAPAPSLAWFWPLIMVLACAPALLRLRRRSLNALTTLVLCCFALVAFVVGQLGFELYGRPQIVLSERIWLAISLVVAGAAVVVLVRVRDRSAIAVVIALLGLYEGLALRDTLLNGFVLAALPPLVMRCAAIVGLAAGTGILLISELDRSQARRIP